MFALMQNSNIVAPIIHQAALRCEFYIACLRIVLGNLLLIRFHYVSPPLSAYTIVVPIMLASFLFSLLYLYYFKQGTPSRRWFWASVTLDIANTYCAYLGNALSPSEDFPGNLLVPDMAIALLITVASGFRLCTKVALWSGLLSILSFAFLIKIESLWSPTLVVYSSKTISMWLLLLLAATVAAIMCAQFTHSLACKGAQATQKLQDTYHQIQNLLESHHDAHSLLTSVNLNAAPLIQHAKHLDTQTKLSHLKQHADWLARDLSAIQSCVQQVKTQADGHLRANLIVSSANLIDATIKATESYQALTPNMKIHLHTSRNDYIYVSIAGGTHSLNRIMMNLLKNAQEGNGQKGAKNVEIRIKADAYYATLFIRDDGPGFEDLTLKSLRDAGKTTGFKAGLTSVNRIVMSSQGKLFLKNTSSEGGAEICIKLPLHPIN